MPLPLRFPCPSYMHVPRVDAGANKAAVDAANKEAVVVRFPPDYIDTDRLVGTRALHGHLPGCLSVGSSLRLWWGEEDSCGGQQMCILFGLIVCHECDATAPSCCSLHACCRCCSLLHSLFQMLRQRFSCDLLPAVPVEIHNTSARQIWVCVYESTPGTKLWAQVSPVVSVLPSARQTVHVNTTNASTWLHCIHSYAGWTERQAREGSGTRPDVPVTPAPVGTICVSGAEARRMLAQFEHGQHRAQLDVDSLILSTAAVLSSPEQQVWFVTDPMGQQCTLIPNYLRPFAFGGSQVLIARSLLANQYVPDADAREKQQFLLRQVEACGGVRPEERVRTHFIWFLESIEQLLLDFRVGGGLSKTVDEFCLSMTQGRSWSVVVTVMNQPTVFRVQLYLGAHLQESHSAVAFLLAKCAGCQEMLNPEERLWLQCPECDEIFCLDCDEFVHTSLHNCPGCLSGVNEHRSPSRPQDPVAQQAAQEPPLKRPKLEPERGWYSL